MGVLRCAPLFIFVIPAEAGICGLGCVWPPEMPAFAGMTGMGWRVADGSVQRLAPLSLEAEGHGLVADGAFVVEGDGGLVGAAQAGFPGLPRFLGGAGGKM